MISLKQILKKVPILGWSIELTELEREIEKEKQRTAEEIRYSTPEAKRRILTLTPEQYALMHGRRVSDYDVIGLMASSPDDIYWRDGGEDYARSYAMVKLLGDMNAEGIETTVAAHYDTLTMGMGSMGNPHRYKFTVYG